MGKGYGSNRSFFRGNSNRGQFPFPNKVAIDTASEQIYFPEYMLPPLGYQEHIDIRRATRICEILESSLDDYTQGFINYFMNDSHTITQCLNILSLKDSVDSSLVKKITFECGTPRVMPSIDMETSTTTSRYYGRSQSHTGHSSTASTPRRRGSGNIFSSQLNEPNQRGASIDMMHEDVRRISVGNESGPYKDRDRINPSGSLSPVESSSVSYMDDSATEGALSHSGADFNLPFNSLMAQNGSPANDDAHYMKVSQYRSFFLDITKLLTEVPILGSDIMTAPQVMLMILDKKIVPLLFEILDSIMKAGCSPKHEEILDMFNNTYELRPISAEALSVNQYLEKVLNDVYCKNTLEYSQKHSDIRNFHFTTRMKNIPPTLSLWKDTVDQISDKDVGNVVVLMATVTRVGAISVLDEEREYRCSKCHQSVIAKAIPELHYFISIPTKCTHVINGERRLRCYGDTFIQGAAIKRTDIQEIRCQSISRGSSIAYVGGTTAVLLRRDITGTCIPGDNIHIVAFVKRRWNSLRNGKKCESQIFLDAINVEVMNMHKTTIKTPNTPLYESMYYPFWSIYKHDEIAGRQVLLDHMCNTLVSVDNAKLALLLTVIGGFPPKDEGVVEQLPVNRWAKYTSGDKRANPGTSKVSNPLHYGNEDEKEAKLLRTQCHILLLGCPGTGKSQFLKYAKTLVDRHVSVSGTNCTSAGLTCTIIRDGANSMLSAGALVLADGGMCCIDEFALIHPDDKACLHEAMEQQVISVAKVGIKCSLNCRCTIIAASNFKVPKGKNNYSYDDLDSVYLPPEKMILNIDVPLPLLSRFDTIVVFTENPLNDNELVDFLLHDVSSDRHGSYRQGGYKRSESNQDEDGSQSQKSTSQNDLSGNGESVDWDSPNALKNYIEFIKTSLFPVMTESAKNVIYAYYMAMRKHAQDVELQGGPTVRTIESLIRLSQAHARLMLRDHVNVFDTVSVIWMGEFALQGFKIGMCNGNDQVIDRQGLFPNVKELFRSYCRRYITEEGAYKPKIGNGITSMEMYHYFEDILLRRLHLTKIEATDGTIGVYPSKE